MTSDEKKRALQFDLLLASAMVALGLTISGVSVAKIAFSHPQQHFAQATPPLQGTPSTDTDQTPAPAKPGGERPTTPAPQPARPSAGAQKDGVTPALPPAPAEKTAPPIEQK